MKKFVGSLFLFVATGAIGQDKTREQWCADAMTQVVANPNATVQARDAIKEAMHNAGCFNAPTNVPQNQTSHNENVRQMVCGLIPALISDPTITDKRLRAAAKIARENHCGS